jgi:hypothetical protein
VLYSSESGEIIENGENSNLKSNTVSNSSAPLTYSPDLNQSKKKSSVEASASNNSQSNYSKNINITNNNPNNNTENSHSNSSNKSASVTNTATKNIKDVITKRKLLLLEKQKKIMKDISESPEELRDLVEDYTEYSKMKNKIKNNNPFLSNVKINNITNIILPKSFDIKTPKNDMMLRDIKALHLITQKALSTNSKYNPVDSIDDERKSFMHFNNVTSKKALFIDDNSNDISFSTGGYVSSTAKHNKADNQNFNHSNSFTFSNNVEENNKIKSQVINIININNNYNIGNINMTSSSKNNSGGANQFNACSNASKKSYNTTMNLNGYKKTNLYNCGNKAEEISSTPIDSGRSQVSNKTHRGLIPKNSPTGGNMPNKSIKDIISSVKKDVAKPKEKFIKLTK